MTRYLYVVLLIVYLSSCRQRVDGTQIPIASDSVSTNSPALVEFDSALFPYQPDVLHKESSSILTAYSGYQLYQVSAGETRAIVFEAGLTVTAHGAPKAYHAKSDMGLDDLKQAGKKGNWRHIATDNGLPTGKPLLQGPKDPAPGYYISTTRLVNPELPVYSPAKYVNASEIAYFVLPPSVRAKAHMALGDIGAVFYQKTNRLVYAILADNGDEGHLGKGSIALAHLLGINDNPRTEGVSNGVTYILFSGSGNGLPKSRIEIENIGHEYLQKVGGLKRIEKVLAAPPSST